MSFSPALIPFRDVDRWGYASPDRKVVIPCEFDHAYPFHGIEVAHVTLDGRSGLMGIDGKLVLPFEYDWIGDEDEGAFKAPGGVLVLRQGERFGAASSRGELLVPVDQPDSTAALAAATLVFQEQGNLPEGLPRPVERSVAARYESAEPYDNGFALVQRGGLTGYVDESGVEVIAPTLEEAYSFDETGAAPVKKGGRFGHIDRKGEAVTPFEFDDAYSFVNGAAIVMKDGRYGLVRRDGRMIVPCAYEQLADLHEGRAVACKNGGFGYIDEDGREVIPLEYNSAERFQGGLGRVSKDGTWGLLRRSGEVAVPLECDPPDWDSGTFPEYAEGRHPVRKGGMWGFVDAEGAEAVPCRFRWAWGFRDGLARVAIPDPKAVRLSMPGGGAAALNLFGWVRLDGTLAIPHAYSLARDFEDGVSRVQSAETTQDGYIDPAGTEFWKD